MNFLIRSATAADIPAITRIYAPAVLHGSSSFELEPPDEKEMERRRCAVLEAGFPYLVAAENDGKVLGYAYASAYRMRPAYRFTVENSIYVAPDFQRRGVGRMLMNVLIEACTRGGFRQMLAVIGDSTNQTGSVALHLACGFRRVGQLPDVGFKHGRWVDTVLMQRELGEGSRISPR